MGGFAACVLQASRFRRDVTAFRLNARPRPSLCRWCGGSWVTARRWALGDESAEAAAVAGYHLVDGVEQRRCVEHPENAPEGPREPDLGEERDAAPRIAWNRRPIAKDEPPAFIPRFFRHSREQTRSLG